MKFFIVAMGVIYSAISYGKDKFHEKTFIALTSLIALNTFFNMPIKNNIFYVPVITLLLIILLFFSYIIRREKPFFQKNDVLIILILGSMLVILLIQNLKNPIYNPKLFVRIFFQYLCFFMMYVMFIQKRYKDITIDFGLKIIAWFSLYNSLLSFLQFILNKKLLIGEFNESLLYTEGLVVVKRVVGVVGANNGAGNLGAILFPVLLLYMLRSKNVFSVIVFILNIIFTFLTLTRVGIFTQLIVLIVWYIFYPANNQKKLIVKYLVFISFLFFGVVFFYFAWDKFYQILFINRGQTGSYRFYQFMFIPDLISYLGIGGGNFEPFVELNYGVPKIGILHSQWLNTIVEQGKIFFCLYLLVLFNLLMGIRNKFKNKDNKWFTISLFISYVIPINFNPNQYYEVNNFIFFLILIMLNKFRLEE